MILLQANRGRHDGRENRQRLVPTVITLEKRELLTAASTTSACVSMPLTAAEIAKIAPPPKPGKPPKDPALLGAYYENYANTLNTYNSNVSALVSFLDSEQATSAGIDTPERQAAFVGQVVGETGLTQTVEQPSKYTGPNFANYDVEGPTPLKAISLGNYDPGDGAKYRGEGLIQLTGKFNFEAASQAIFGNDTLVNDPSLVSTDPSTDIAVAAYVWDSFQYHGQSLNELADKGDIADITKRINGSDLGLSRRQKATSQALGFLNMCQGSGTFSGSFKGTDSSTGTLNGVPETLTNPFSLQFGKPAANGNVAGTFTYTFSTLSDTGEVTGKDTIKATFSGVPMGNQISGTATATVQGQQETVPFSLTLMGDQISGSFSTGITFQATRKR